VTVERYIGDRFVGPDAERSGVLSKAKDGAIYNADDSPFHSYVQKSGAWQRFGSSAFLNGTGTANYVPLWQDSDTLINSVLYQNGSKIGVNTISPDGTFHAFSASAGSVTAHTSADEGVFEAGGNGGISILTPSGNIGNLYWGNDSDNDAGRVSYDHPSNLMTFYVSGVDHMRLKPGGQLMVGGTYVDSLYANSTGPGGIGLFEKDSYNSCGTHIEVSTLGDDAWASLYLSRHTDGGTYNERYLDCYYENVSIFKMKGSGTYMNLETPASVDLKLGAGASTAIFIDSSTQYVGVNELTPNYTLSVGGDVGLVNGSYDRPALENSYFGYSSAWRTLILGSTSTSYNSNITGSTTLCFGVDVSSNPQSQFQGDGRELIFRDGADFFTPDSTNTAYHSMMSFNAGNVTIGSSVSGDSMLYIGTSALETPGDESLSALSIKQTTTDSRGGIYIERYGERRGYYLGVGGTKDAFTIEGNSIGVKSDILSITRDKLMGLRTTDPRGVFEVEDGGASEGVILKVTQDDDNIYGMIVGNDTFSTGDDYGAGVYLSLIHI
jgi:hypothetical protein